MKKLALIIILVLIVASAYLYYQRTGTSSALNSRLTTTPQLKFTKAPLNSNNLSKVLGEATSIALTTAGSLLNSVTDKEGEPIINKTLENLQREVKDLPREQYDKVKYQFCQDVIKDYEGQQ